MASQVFGPGFRLSDEEVVVQVLEGNTALFEVLMRRHNQLVYRAARAILREDAEAEDVMQDAYVRAYQNLRQFAGRSQFSTWITRIAVNEAFKRRLRGNRYEEPRPMSDEQETTMDRFESPIPNPEQHVSTSETRRLLEQAIEGLPDLYRSVFVLRDVQDMDTESTAIALEISADTVKTRLHRARALLRKHLYMKIGACGSEAFSFHATRCDRVVRNVLERLNETSLGEV